jgi:hypothetical protein
MKQTINTCCWTSQDKRYRCSRPIFGDSDYCLFHKPNKNEEESFIFWKVINWNWEAGLNNHEKEIYNILKWHYPKLNKSEKININNQSDIILQKVEENNFNFFEKKKENFEQLKQEILNQQYIPDIWKNGANFSGFVFPKNETVRFDYKYSKIDYSTHFNFSEAVFEGPADFSGYNFLGDVKFDQTEFKQWVIFTNSIFHKSCSFLNIKKMKMHLGGVDTFGNTKFIGHKVVFDENIISSLKGILFSEHTVLEIKNMNFPKDFGTAYLGEETYRIAKNQAQRTGDYEKAGEYYYLERLYRGYQILPELSLWEKNQKGFKKFDFLRQIKKENYLKLLFPKFSDWLMKITTGYGEKPRRVIISSLVFIFIFTLLFSFSSDNISFSLHFNLCNFSEKFTILGNSLYTSFVTFTTLGFVPEINKPSFWQKILFASESFLGALMMGLYVLTLSKKYTR